MARESSSISHRNWSRKIGRELLWIDYHSAYNYMEYSILCIFLTDHTLSPLAIILCTTKEASLVSSFNRI